MGGKGREGEKEGKGLWEGGKDGATSVEHLEILASLPVTSV